MYKRKKKKSFIFVDHILKEKELGSVNKKDSLEEEISHFRRVVCVCDDVPNQEEIFTKL